CWAISFGPPNACVVCGSKGYCPAIPLIPWQTMAKKLFGTDGIRGIAGQYPLDPQTTHAFGMALGAVARHLDPAPQIVIGMDTRESGPWIAGQVAGGLKEAGVGVRFAGVVTTPGVAF